MTYFSEALKACMQKNGVGAAELARACGMDRTQVHRYANGTRTPGDITTVESLLAGLRLSVKEKENLYECYFRTEWGDYVYESNQLIGDILKQMNENASLLPNKKSDEERFYLGINEAIEDEKVVEFVRALKGRTEILRYMDKLLLGLAGKQDAELKMIVQPNHNHFKSKVRSFARNCMNAKIEHIICLERKPDDEKLENLQILNAVLPLFGSMADYHAYYYYNEIDEHINTMTIMPNVMIGKKAVLAFDYEMENGIIFQQQEIVGWYHDIFAKMKENCSEFGKGWGDTNDFLETVDQLNYNSLVSFQINRMPCLGKCLSRDIYEAHAYEYLPNRAQLIDFLCQATGEWKNGKYIRHNESEEPAYQYFSFFSKEGLMLFFENGRVTECPDELYEPLPLDVCITMVERMLKLMEDGYIEYRILKKYTDPSDDLILNVYETIDKVSFLLTTDIKRTEINIFESGIVQSFRNYKKYLLESGVTYSKEETIQIVNELIEYYKENGRNS